MERGKLTPMAQRGDRRSAGEVEQRRGVLVTVGHSTHDEARFIGLLKEARVQTVVDVRAQPRSRRNPQFNAAALAASLEAAEIGYETLGRELGGRRTPAEGSSLNAAWDDEAFRGYADHMASREFADGLADLAEIARESRTAIMCAEGDWRICHRRLVADAMTTSGWTVLHLRPDGGLEEHELDDRLVLEDDGRLTYPVLPGQTSLEV
jgi:uncharacterized protein (DUF488 family)